MKVQDLMTTVVASCRPTTDLAAVATMMWQSDCGAVPVVDEDLRVLGMVTDRDICIAAATRRRRPEELSAGEVMSGRIHAVHAEDDVRRALEVMRTRKVRRLPVIDAERRIQGIVSLSDLISRSRTPEVRAGRNEVPLPYLIETMKSVCERSGASRPARTRKAGLEPEEAVT